MMTKPLSLIASLLVCCLHGPAAMAKKPETPRIDCVIPLPRQPQAENASTIWYDDFDGGLNPKAMEGSPLDDKMAFGQTGRSLRCLYEKGKRGQGGCKVFFGDSPTYRNVTVRSGEQFNEIYWRIYVKHQYGWKGSPAKMSRATSLVTSNWAQAMIAHVWSSHHSSLTLDPVRCVNGDQTLGTKYNDWQAMTWLGNKPVSKFPIHATEESGYWVLVECRVKLNTPGKSDGINQLWIDGRLECERKALDFRGSYTKHGINAVFLEAYWNDGSPVTQSRWYDNFVISTEPIGPVVCPHNPTIVKTPHRGRGRGNPWQVEVAEDFEGKNVVFRSNLLLPKNRTVIENKQGRFLGKLAGKNSLTSGKTYYLRVRQQGARGVMSLWSRWHQGFQVTN